MHRDSTPEGEAEKESWERTSLRQNGTSLNAHLQSVKTVQRNRARCPPSSWDSWGFMTMRKCAPPHPHHQRTGKELREVPPPQDAWGLMNRNSLIRAGKRIKTVSVNAHGKISVGQQSGEISWCLENQARGWRMRLPLALKRCSSGYKPESAELQMLRV